MRVTDYFGLGLSQARVDFVDVDVTGDIPVYIDPTAIRNQSGLWAESCVTLLQSFFVTLLRTLAQDDTEVMENLLSPLKEPNETHLGDSAGASRGRSLGTRGKAEELLASLRRSRAVQSGLLADLEDTALLVPGIDRDIISDITTSVIRQPLIQYTQMQCKYYGIPLEPQLAGPVWDPYESAWFEGTRSLPRANENILLLVPRAIVRVKLTVDKGKFYRGYIRPIYEREELNHPAQGLVRVLRNGQTVVRKGALDKKLGTAKDDVARRAAEHPETLVAYKGSLSEVDTGPMPLNSFEQMVGGSLDTPRRLLEEVRAIPPGAESAHKYHRAIAGLFSTLFSEALGNQNLEAYLRAGSKRVDIMYDNVARAGFFWWISEKVSPTPLIVVECKNYSSDVKNPEFDQVAMRLSDQRGRLGFLVSRKFKDKDAALARAEAIASDQKSFVIVLDDEDLSQLVSDFERADGDLSERLNFPLLRIRLGRLLGQS